eukprot:CAMPEP_0118945096 /NCGR_PEP_ID=MMETSP1169-20130426/41613_1 /TAXON_ID=36882 /ORGANISM="Pyramimonas obovata, Strain CCMP722" /LENGTH=289 /DNA_ID=CAMNT_0006890737 /DNA_START=156 /DNA_END=1022 /DNA_ORIENTATION=+
MLYGRGLSTFISGVSHATSAPRASATSLRSRPVSVSGIHKPSAIWGTFWRETSAGLKVYSDFHGSSPLAFARPSGARALQSSVRLLTEAKLEAGKLVEYGKSSDNRELGLLERPDGKKNWMILNRYGKLSSVNPNTMSFVLPGAGYKLADIVAMEEQSESISDDSLLELGWEVLAMEKRAGVEVADLAQMLFAASEAVHCYATHRMLTQDSVYFKQRGDKWEPRPADQVASLKKQLAATVHKEAAIAALVQEVADAMKGGAENAPAGPPLSEEAETHIQALEAFALDLD